MPEVALVTLRGRIARAVYEEEHASLVGIQAKICYAADNRNIPDNPSVHRLISARAMNYPSLWCNFRVEHRGNEVADTLDPGKQKLWRPTGLWAASIGYLSTSKGSGLSAQGARSSSSRRDRTLVPRAHFSVFKV